jgi:XisI protein
MDTLTTYREIVKQVISDYAKLRPSHGNIHLDTVFDEQQDRYALMQVGWDRGHRVRGNLIYVTIDTSTPLSASGKVSIEYDGMECGITQDLIERGIPDRDIILAFLPESRPSAIV